MLVDAACGHAAVRGLDDDGDTFRLQYLLYNACYLSSEPFLYLEPTGERIHYSCQFGDSNDPALWQVSDMGKAVIGAK